MDELLTGNEIAKLLKISRAAAYRLMGTVLPAVRFGRCIRVPKSKLESYIGENTKIE
jgi:excisionase family DNA binding protein